MDQAHRSTLPRINARALIAAALMHVVVVLALIRAFAPDAISRAVGPVFAAFDVTDPSPKPVAPPPPPSPRAEEIVAPRPGGGAASVAAPRAAPLNTAQPRPQLVIASPLPAPSLAAHGLDPSLGAALAGAGTGAGIAGNGQGTGAGAGAGNGQARKFVQIAGTIDSTRDYPRATRDLRVGTEVVIVFTVGTDGRVHDCRVRQPSGDPRSDAITCRLAERRFRFRPSTDAGGKPVEALYGWRQRWFY